MINDDDGGDVGSLSSWDSGKANCFFISHHILHKWERKRRERESKRDRERDGDLCNFVLCVSGLFLGDD